MKQLLAWLTDGRPSTRTRLTMVVAVLMVGVGVVAAVGAVVFDPTRSGVGPLPAEGLILPADSRFVMGFDVRRFTASPFYARFSQEHGMQPEALREFEAKTGLDPTRDVDQIVVAGVGKDTPGLALLSGRFDVYKLGRSLETEGRARGYSHEGVTLYSLKDGGTRPLAIAFLDRDTLLFGGKERVEAAVGSRTRGDAPLRGNAGLIGLLGKLRPGSTFWMVGDQTLLAAMPASMPSPGQAGTSLSLPALRGVTITGDVDPQISVSVTGETADEAAARNLADVVRGLVALASLQAQQKPQLQQLAAAVSVATEANRVLVSARIPYELLDALRTVTKPPAAPETPALPTTGAR